MNPPIDIGPELAAICAKLGFPDRSVVSEVRIGVGDATVLYFRLNDSGHKFVEIDGEAATRWRSFRVTT